MRNDSFECRRCKSKNKGYKFSLVLILHEKTQIPSRFFRLIISYRCKSAFKKMNKHPVQCRQKKFNCTG
jgi:hypothetical protein